MRSELVLAALCLGFGFRIYSVVAYTILLQKDRTPVGIPGKPTLSDRDVDFILIHAGISRQQLRAAIEKLQAAFR